MTWYMVTSASGDVRQRQKKASLKHGEILATVIFVPIFISYKVKKVRKVVDRRRRQ